MSGDDPRGIGELKTEEVAAVLAELCPTTAVSSLQPGPASYSNRLWLAETDEGRLLVRVPGRTDDPEYVRATLTATRLAGEAGVPTVRYRAFAPTTRLGLPVVVQEFRPGENAATALRRNGADLRHLAGRLGEWVGLLHGVRRDTFGAVTDSGGGHSWSEAAAEDVRRVLAAVDEDLLPAGRGAVESAFHRAIGELGPTGPASLVHGDLYLDNVLVDRGTPSALLDFEHARFRDRFADFGKLTELLFEWWPGSEEPFLESYREHFPADPSDEPRLRLGTGLYALSQLGYFARWQADLVPVYRARLENWVRGR
ncbi:phosphotransferase family protein [Saccharothrix yanglingensis]|uniref:phosphotransferase family protein n=1 Tax=Saccharothrix yanglingensis TaxID=659496 RepID=UPI0027D266BE|nr:aminoglycoside phosphotransferase family protein [Saccharothrix yanglingensis]